MFSAKKHSVKSCKTCDNLAVDRKVVVEVADLVQDSIIEDLVPQPVEQVHLVIPVHHGVKHHIIYERYLHHDVIPVHHGVQHHII